jgi:hypothetical protein
LAFAFLKINETSTELQKYSEFIFNKFKQNINNNLKDTSFEEKIKSNIIDIIFEKNGLIYIKDSKIKNEKELNPIKKKNVDPSMLLSRKQERDRNNRILNGIIGKK